MATLVLVCVSGVLCVRRRIATTISLSLRALTLTLTFTPLSLSTFIQFCLIRRIHICIDLISSANCIFMPSFRAFVSERQLFFIYFMISLVGVVFLTAAIFSRSFSCWVVGSLVYLGISEGGIDSIKSSMYASRCTFTPCIPKIFSLSSFAIGILQTATHFYLVQSFWT